MGSTSAIRKQKKMKLTLKFTFILLLFFACKGHEDKVGTTAHDAPVTAYPAQEIPVKQTGQAHSEKSLPRDAYIQWIKDPDNGLSTHEQTGGLKFALFYKPLDYVVLQEMTSSAVGIDSFPALRRDYEGMQYFTLTISSADDADILKHGISNERSYYDRIDYCSFRMQSDIQLVDGTDTLACRIFHYERNFQVAPYTHFSLAFEDINKTGNVSDKTLVFHDQAFGKGIVKLKIKANDLKKIPNLSLN